MNNIAACIATRYRFGHAHEYFAPDNMARLCLCIYPRVCVSRRLRNAECKDGVHKTANQVKLWSKLVRSVSRAHPDDNDLLFANVASGKSREVMII